MRNKSKHLTFINTSKSNVFRLALVYIDSENNKFVNFFYKKIVYLFCLNIFTTRASYIGAALNINKDEMVMS